MLLIGYFEGIDAERGIAWRAADSLALPASANWIAVRSRGRETAPPQTVLKRLFIHAGAFNLGPG